MVPPQVPDRSVMVTERVSSLILKTGEPPENDQPKVGSPSLTV